MSAPRAASTVAPRRAGAGFPAGSGGERGFTLVELAVSLGVFMVGALTLALVMPMATRRLENATMQTRASQLAAECSEHILATPWDHDDLASGTHGDPGNPRDGHYYVRWSVETDQPIVSCKRVTVSVSRGSTAGVALAQIVVVVPRAGVTSP